MKPLPRLMPALVTPFDRRGELDLDAHAHNLRKLAELGIGGFLIAGSTGEGSLLDPGERAVLLSAVRDTLGRRPMLISGIWAESVRQAVRQLDESAEAAADAALVVTPTTLARRSIPAQKAFFSAVADESPIPVLLYSVPPNTGYGLDERATIELSNHPNIVGMKDSGGDAVRIQRILAHTPEGFQMFNGATRSVALAMAAGARGAITASTNYMPELMLDLVDTARRSTAKAMPIQHRATAASDIAESLGVPGVKVAAESAGLRAGRPRSPLVAPGRKQTSTILEFRSEI